MINVFRPLVLSLLLTTSLANAADPSFYFISAGEKGDAVLFHDPKLASKTDLPYALVDRPTKGCCFKAGVRRGAGKATNNGDGDNGSLMSEEDKPIVKQAGYLDSPAKTEFDLAYGFEGMQSVARKGRDAYQVTLAAGRDSVFVRTCYSGEGLKLKLFHKLADKQPYASYYYYLGYEVEPTCR